MFQSLLNLLDALVAAALAVRVPDKLQVKEFTLQTNETYSTSTVRYESPEAAKVVWMSEHMQYGDNEVFLDGEGQSTVSVDNKFAQAVVFQPGGNDLFLIRARSGGQYAVPDTDILFSAGDDIIYTPGVPLDVNITWTNLKKGRGFDQMTWKFFGLKPSVSREPIIRYGRGYSEDFASVIDVIGESTSAQYHQMHVRFNFQDESGFLFFHPTRYFLPSSLRIQRGKLVTVHPEGQNVFPRDFLDILRFKQSGYCTRGESCELECYAFGPRITSLVVQDSNGRKWQPSVSYNNDWAYAGYFRFPPPVGDQDEYNVTCVATNDHSQSVELVFYFRIAP